MSFRTLILRQYVKSTGPKMAQTNYCCNLYENLHISEKCFDVNEQTLNMSSLLFIIQSKNTSAMKKNELDKKQELFRFFIAIYVDAAKCGWLGKAIWFQKNKMYLRYESSTLILYKELSSSIFQSLSVSQASVTPDQISTFCNI